ncbi:hypothetical protein PoB_001695100 [Plakobranchus ocellatus]|uniref:Uncharacterized protein n=1 Tax=Plakobranchus ocellatus TaxID=259542 RepID=A0AAV3Z763_9GAST|nr:hypothetical protein PoB_001695100 [Plakobranchus ocellatus]
MELCVASSSPATGPLAGQRDLNNWIQVYFVHDNVGDDKLANNYRNQAARGKEQKASLIMVRAVGGTVNKSSPQI